MASEPDKLTGLEELESLPECPVCHQGDRVEKASGILRRNSGQVFVGDSPVGYRFVSGIAAEFAIPLAPAAPTWPSVSLHILASLAIVAIVAASYFGARDIADLKIPSEVEIALAVIALWFGILAPIKTVAETIFRRQRAQRHLPAWRGAMSRWDSLYYCVRDDVGFVKGSSEWRTPDRVQELLYSGVRSEPVSAALTAAPEAPPLRLPAPESPAEVPASNAEATP